jgi:cytoskeletal protein CcmA (bactofilin family)
MRRMKARSRRAAATIVGLVLALIALVAVVSAADGDPGSKVLANTQDVVVPAGTTIDHDLYAFGSTVEIAGTVTGDLTTAAARVIVSGTVTGDVLGAASEVSVTGTVGGDVRVATSQLTILGAVGEDVAVFASSLVLGAEGRIGGDLLFTASQASLEGNVAGGIAGSATDYQRRGTVGGTEEVSLTTRLDQPPADRAVALALDALRQYLLVLLFGLALLRFAPKLSSAVIDRARTQPFLAAGAGVVVVALYVGLLLGIVVLMVLLGVAFGELGFDGFVLIDLVGGLLAAFGISFAIVFFSAFIADAIVGSAIGRLVAIADGSRWAGVIRLAVGAALVVVLTSFPTLGSIVKLLVILVGLGAFAGVLWDRRRRPAAPMSPVLAPPPVA